jgi:hypothetical protein
VEIFGTLLDNGCKWQKSRTGLDESRIDFAFRALSYDDGPGLEASLRCGVFETRTVR